jgi:hypothetical protein
MYTTAATPSHAAALLVYGRVSNSHEDLAIEYEQQMSSGFMSPLKIIILINFKFSLLWWYPSSASAIACWISEKELDVIMGSNSVQWLMCPY